MCLWNTSPPRRQQSPKSNFYIQGQSQGHKVIDLGVIWKGVISGLCMPNLNLYLLYGSKVIVKVKVDNRQTEKQTDRTKTICPRSFDPGHKKRHRLAKVEYCYSGTDNLWYGSWNRHVCRKGTCATNRPSQSTGLRRKHGRPAKLHTVTRL